MARITKSPEERKQEIVEAALDLFSKKGYDNTTIQDIAERLHIAQGLCYRYFKSKQELFSAAADAYASKFFQQIHDSFIKARSPDEKCNLIIKRLFVHALKWAEFKATYQQESFISDSQITQMTEQIANLLIPIVKDGNASGVFHCEDVENTVRILTFGASGLVHFHKPLQNQRDYILSCIPSIKKISKTLLGAGENSKIGEGWELL